MHVEALGNRKCGRHRMDVVRLWDYKMDLLLVTGYELVLVHETDRTGKNKPGGDKWR